MKKLILLFTLWIISNSVFAQDKDTIYIKVAPPTTKRVILYQPEGGKQKFVAYQDATDGKFKLPIQKTQRKGLYRLVYNEQTMDYLDFIYLGKSLTFSFNPENPSENPVFEDSKENAQYYDALSKIFAFMQKLDAIQVSYFQVEDNENLQALTKEYTAIKKEMDLYMQEFSKTAVNPIVKDLVIAQVSPKPETLIRDPQDYLPFVKEHYFDNLDFSNKNLQSSSILVDMVLDYVFYLTVAQDSETQNKLYQNAVDHVMEKMENNPFKANIIESLIRSFAREENILLTDYLFDTYYKNLDAAYQDQIFTKKVSDELKTAIGRKAANFSWETDAESQDLYSLEGFDQYIIVFWSSSCPHCLKELPKFQTLIKDNNEVKVIAIGLETEESKAKWKSETYYYPEFQHVLGLGKWENNIAQDYNVHATPNYFILDANKKIVSKPYDIEEIKEFYKLRNDETEPEKE